MASPSGDMASPSGDMASPSGDMASPSGDMASTSRADKAIFRVISMNAGPKIKGDAQQRREYVQGVIDKKKPDLVFLQEFPSPDKFIEEIQPTGYQILFGVHKYYKYTTIFYKNELEVKKYNNYDYNSFAGQLFVRRCKKDGSLDLLVASYHGPNTGLTDEQKQDNLCKLLTLLDKVSEETRCHVLVGGDFNLKYKNAINVVQKRNKNNEIKYHLYAAASKKKEKKRMVDYFMYSGPVEDVSNVEIVDEDNELFENKELFDHKPLYANFKQSELARNRHGNAAPSPSPFAKKELFQQENDSPLLDSKISENSELNYLRAENAELKSTAASKKKEKDDMVDYFMYSGPVEDVSNVEIVDEDNELFDNKPLYANFKQSELAQNRHGNAAPSPSPFAKKELFQQENDSPLLDSKISENSELNYLRAENAELKSTVEKLKVDLYYVTKERDFLQTVVKDSRQVVINCCTGIHRKKS